MALLKMLYVKEQAAAQTPDLEKTIAVGWNAPRGTFLGTGDNALAVHAGRAGMVTGVITVEDMTSADAALATAVQATVVFTVISDNAGTAGEATVTFSNFAITGLSETLGDGLAPSTPVPGIALTFEATAVAVAAVP